MGSYSGVTSPLIWVISIVTLLITPLITTHEPPSTMTGSHGDSDAREATSPVRPEESISSSPAGTWRFMGCYKSLNMGVNSSYPTYNPTLF